MGILTKFFSKKTEAMQTQQTAAISQLQKEFSVMQTRGLSPARLSHIMQQATQGDLLAQSELFTDMQTIDAHIYAEMHKRKMAVSQMKWSLKAHPDAGAREKKDVASLEQTLRDTLNINTLLFDMSDAIGRGFQAHEIEWKNNNGAWFPAKLHQREQRWFTVDRETRRQVRLRNNNSIDGIELIPMGWIIHEHSSNTGYPGTQGLFRPLLLPYLYKNYSTRDFAEFLEIYGLPIRLGKYQPGASIEEKQALMSAVVSIGHNAGGIIPDYMQFELLQASNGGGSVPFMAMIDFCENSVSKAILGATLTSDSGKNGNYATAKIHNEVRYQIRDHDAQQIAETLNKQLLSPIITVNGWTIRAKWEFDTQEGEDLQAYAEAIPKLVATGFKIPASYLYDKLKIPMPEGGEEVLSVSAPVSVPSNNPSSSLAAEILTEDTDNSPVTAQADLLAADASPVLKDWVDSIRAKVNTADSLDSLRDDLLNSYGDLDSGELVKVMALAFACSDLSGRFDVSEGN